MDIKKLNEELKTINKDGYNFAEFDVEGLYNTIVPKEHGFISIVRYWSDYTDKFYEIPRKERTEEEIDEAERMRDQMSAFTSVIDNLKWNKQAVQEAFLPNYEVLGTIVQYKDGFNILDDNKEKMLNKNYPSLKKLLQDLANNM